jgi:hypothetical protein
MVLTNILVVSARPCSTSTGPFVMLITATHGAGVTASVQLYFIIVALMIAERKFSLICSLDIMATSSSKSIM